MTIPAWLANVEVEMAICRRGPRDCWLMTPEQLELGLLLWLCPRANQWLDKTRVHGNPEARRVWARICRCFYGTANFLHLRGLENGALAPLVDTCVRLNGLRLTPTPTDVDGRSYVY